MFGNKSFVQPEGQAVAPATPLDTGELWSRTNPFLQGPFEPLGNETSVCKLRVVGEIPRELNGALYRTGSNQQFRPTDPDRFHWFDGDGMVHAFRLRDGVASYCNKWVETDGLKVERAAGRSLYNGIFGTAGRPQGALPAGAPPIKTVAGINVISFAGHVLTMHEVDSFYWKIDGTTLETLGKYDFGGAIDSMLTAHPHFDPATNEMLFYGLDNERQFVECIAARPTGEIVSRHRVDLPIAPFVHDFIFSTTYYVFVFGPLRYRPLSPRTVPAGHSACSFDSGSPGRILLIHRGTGVPTWFETRSFTAGHYLNAFEEDGVVIVDASVTDTVLPDAKVDASDFFPFPLIDAPSPFSGPQLWRLRIDPAAGRVRHERIGDFGAEFVRPNERVMGQRHRYGYMAGIHDPDERTKGFNSLVKHDYRTGTSQFQHLTGEVPMSPGEPIFVARPDATAEDDGWVLSVWFDPRRNGSELVIQAAQDFDAPPLARVKLDHRVPPGFHGNWIADAA